MRSIKLAVKATLDHFAEFVTATSGVTKDKKSGKESPNNARGNIPFIVEGIQFESDADALDYCASFDISVPEVIAGAVNEAKGLAARAAVSELKIPETELVNAGTLADWTSQAQEAATSAADKTVRPEVSTRAQKAAVSATLDSLMSEVKSELSDSDRAAKNAAIVEAVLALNAMGTKF
jgi:hypothetical protein